MKSIALFACENVFPSPSSIFVIPTLELIALKFKVSKFIDVYEIICSKEVYEPLLVSRDALEVIDNELKERYISDLNMLLPVFGTWREDEEMFQQDVFLGTLNPKQYD